MITGIYCATPEQVCKLLDIDSKVWIETSQPLCVGMWRGECICTFGAIPMSLMSDSAYLWLWTPDWLSSAPIILKGMFSHQAKSVITSLLTRYSSLVCNCYNIDSAFWLLFLGARRTGRHLYTFRRK